MKKLLPKFVLSVLIISASPRLGQCQTGAAGVGTSSTNVIWLDAHAMGLANGSQVSSFNDYSGNGNNFSQSTSTKRPIYTTGAINGMPALHFDGVNDQMLRGATPALASANLTYFMVLQRTPLASQMLITASYTSSANKWRLYSNSGANTLVSAQYSPTVQWVGYNDPGAPTFVSTSITPSSLSIHKQGTLQQTKSVTYTAPTGHQNVIIGGTTAGSYNLNGYIAEVIIYNSSLNNLQRILVENYLGAKYGMSIPTDLYAFEATHQIGLVALGSNGVNTQTSARGAGVMELSNASSLNSGDYLLAAHTDFPLDNFTTSDVPVSLAGYERWTRTWRVDETNSIGTTDITFYLAGGYNFANTSTYKLLVDDDGDFSNASIVSGTYNGTLETITFNVDLTDGQYFTLCGDQQILDIHSITSGLWNNPLTWDCTCIPSFQDNVFIEPFNIVTVDADAYTGNLSVEPNGTLTMSSAVTLDINGDWDIIGALNFTDGEVLFSGSLDQYVDASSGSVAFNDITINKTGTLTFYQAQYELNGTLSPLAGALVIDPDPANEFIINSTSSGVEGRIGEIVPPFSITGEFIVKRFLPAGNPDWRDLCSPVIGATFDDWDPDLAMSGPGFPDGCAYDGSDCFRSVRWTKNSVQNNVNNSSDPILNGRGYSVWVADDEVSFSGTTLSVRGTIRDYNDVTLPFTTGWATLGNPYASPVLFSSCIKTTPIGNYFYVYDASIGDYQWYDGASNTASIPELNNGAMNIGQGVWIEVGGSGSITFTESAKTSSATYIRSSENEDLAAYLTISEKASTYKSALSVIQSNSASDGYDELVDMRFLSVGIETAPGFAFDLGDNNLVKRNYFKADNNTKLFNVMVEIKNDGYYSIDYSDSPVFASYKNVLLLDTKTNEYIDLRTEAYTFYATKGLPENRFVFILTNESISQGSYMDLTEDTNVVSESLTITQMGHNLKIDLLDSYSEQAQISLFNIIGQKEVYVNQVLLNEGANFLTCPEDLRGIYLLSITIGSKVITKKIVL